MKYEILNAQGEVINTIVATPEFVEAQFPGMYREVVELPLPVPVPASITMRQCRLQLLTIGMLDDVDAAINAIPDEGQRRAAQIEWEYAAEVWRTSAWVTNLGAALGLTEAQLDDLFIQAATL